jgi:hypothetical protein
MTMLRSTATGIGCVVSLSARSQAGSAQAQPLDAAGDMHVPNKYRTHYEYLGSWSVARTASTCGTSASKPTPR